MDELLQDLRFALRFLMRNKRSTSIVVLCLATGIAMTTTTFSGVSSWVFRALPWEDPWQLVGLNEFQREVPEATSGVSGPNYRDWVRQARSFGEISAFERANFSMNAADEPERILGALWSQAL